jgi:peptidylprolyl isomerase
LKRILFLLLGVAIVAIVTACNPAPAATPAPTNAPATSAVSSGGLPAALNNPTESVCLGVQPNPNEQIPTDGTTKQWTQPETVTFGDRTYCAILTTPDGRIVIELFPQIAPQNVNNFVFLARQGFYENITFHRVLQDFMAQSGDPTGTGAGGPGYGNIPLEVNPNVNYNREGRLGVARTNDPNSAGSQFFITFLPTPNLDQGYTIMGQVVEGMNVVRQIDLRDPEQGGPPGEKLISVRIVEVKK